MLGDHGIIFSLAVFVWNSLNIILNLMLMAEACCQIKLCPPPSSLYLM